MARLNWSRGVERDRHIARIVPRAVSPVVAELDGRIENIDPVEMAQTGQRRDRLAVEKRSVPAAEIFDEISAPLRDDPRVPSRDGFVRDADVATGMSADHDDVAAQIYGLPRPVAAQDFEDCHNLFPIRSV